MTAPESSNLRGTVRQVYQLPGKRLLVLDDNYEGDVEAGDWVEVTSPEGRSHRVQIDSVALGSAVKSLNPPLTLICIWGDAPEPVPGSGVRGIVEPTIRL